MTFPSGYFPARFIKDNVSFYISFHLNVMTRFAFVVLFSTLTFTAFAQDDLVDFDLVQFQSEFEKKVFTDYVRKGEKNSFSLFMASGSLLSDQKVVEAQTRLNSFLDQYTDPKFQAKKPERKSRQIHSDLQKMFLFRYKDNAAFEEIFHNGDYSDISALGLYAIAFDYAKIPYSIKDEANDLYILAYPHTDKIKLELTMSGHAMVKPTIEFKHQYVQLLKTQKVVTEAEVSKLGVSAVFDKFYYGTNTLGITVPNVVGLQYYNQAVGDLQQNKFATSFNSAEKAYLLYPSPKTAYLLAVAGTNAFAQRKQLDSVKAIQLAKLSKFGDNGVTPEMIEAEFIQATQQLLFNRSDKTEMERFHKVLTDHVSNIRIKNDIDFVYYYETGRFLYNRGRYTEALTEFERAYKIKPTNQNASSALINAISWKVSSARDGKVKVKIMEGYQEQYPSLSEDNNFNKLVLSTYLLKMISDFESGNATDGEKYRIQFEQTHEKFSDVHADHELIGSAYSSAAYHYYRKGQTQKAKALLDAGLKQSPDNYMLVSGKKVIK